MGQTVYASNANGTESVYTYDPQQLYRLTNKRTTSSAGGESGFASMSRNSSLSTAAKNIPLIGEYAVSNLSEAGVEEIFDRSNVIRNKYKREKAAFVLRNIDDQSTEAKIGSDSSVFEPELNLSKWNHEVNFKIKPKNIDKAKVNGLAVEKNVIKYKGQDREYHFYDIPSDNNYPDGAYEFEEILNKKPESNIFEYDIDATNLDFFYQPALNDGKLPEGATKCSVTKCTDAKGNIIAQRPEDIVGSYAVYHKEKQGDYTSLGGQNYRSGKAFHIYRPKIKDANGNWIWGELNIDTQDNKLTITVPQIWLNKAVYPIVVDPTFGYGKIGASAFSGGAANRVRVSKETSPIGAIVPTSISFAVENNIGTEYLKGLIYSTGGTLITNAIGSAVNVSSAYNGWATSTFSTSPSLNASTEYLLGFVSQYGRENFYADSGSGNYYYAAGSYSAPSNITPVFDATRRSTVYITYGSGGSSNPGTPTTKDAYSITENSAILDASLDIKDATSTNIFFQYGLTTSYGSTSSIRTLFASSTSATSSISGLTASTTYHFRAVATSTNSGAQQYGQDKTFTTSIADDPIFVEVIQDLSYTYDKVGNIKQIIDASNLDTAKTVDYTYDNLYRLTRASSTGAAIGGQSSGSQMSMSALPSYIASDKYISSLYGELMMPSEVLDISASSVADDYYKSEIIKNKYDLVNSAFVQKDTGSNDISITVGDPASGNFLPELNIGKWGGEASFKIRPDVSNVAITDQSLSLEGNIIKFIVPDKEYHFYDIPSDNSYPEGAYEFEEILNKKPESNIFEYDIDAKNLNFFYQPALNDEKLPEGAAKCSETKCTDAKGNTLMERPENIVGSYAAYHKEKQGDFTQLGGNNYMAGKAFHIYRPKIKDANGSWTWGELNIDTQKNKLTITVPQNWLNKVVYPVVVDPKFGFETGGGTDDTNIQSYIKGGMFMGAAGTGSSMSAYVGGMTTGDYRRMGIYKDSNDTKLTNGETGEIHTVKNNDWDTINFTSAPTLTEENYYLVYWHDNYGNPIPHIHYDSTGNGIYKNVAYTYGALPANINSHSSNSNKYSIYVTYSSGSSTNPGIPTTKDAFSITQTSAVLDASLDIKDATSTNLFFQYGLTASYGSTSSIKTLFASSTSATSSISGLSASTTYHFRAVATSTNSGTPQYGQDKTFTTSSTPVSYPGQPTTKDAFSITNGSAILDASLDIRNATSTNLFFQYGLTTSYGSTSSIRTLFASTTSATSSIYGLTASTTYHFRAVATSTNDGTPQYGADKAFTTSPSTSGPDYLETYTYNAIGNILNKSDQGNYTYTDNGYNNPHAVTAIWTTSQGTSSVFSYDSNGNVTGDGIWSYSWDYRHRLTQAVKGTTTVRYAYDDQDNRILYSVNGKATTTIVNKYYEITGATSTKHIYANNQLVATIEGNNVYYVHTDHLGGSNVVTNSSGAVQELIDYYPYGSVRLDEKAGSFNEKKKFTGHTFDADTGLNYMNSRYQNGAIGRFISIDPLSNDLGIDNDSFSQKYGRDISEILSDPQSFNSYSYVKNNPLKYTDPTGEFWWYGFYDWSGYSGVNGFMMKAGEVLGGHERALNAIQQNEAAVTSNCAKTNVDPKLANAIIYEEQSHLMPDEVLGREQLAPNAGHGGVGVMQVSGKVGKEYGYSKAELARDPAKNIEAGVKNIAKEQKRSNSPAQTASKYNNSSAKGVTAYGQRVSAQVQNPSYNRNIVTDIKNIYSTVKTLYNIIKK